MPFFFRKWPSCPYVENIANAKRKFKKVFLFLLVCGHGRRRNSIQAQDLWNELNNVYVLYSCADIIDVAGRGGWWVVCDGPCRVSKLVHRGIHTPYVVWQAGADETPSSPQSTHNAHNDFYPGSGRERGSRVKAYIQLVWACLMMIVAGGCTSRRRPTS
jgi:hypothetical protein